MSDEKKEQNKVCIRKRIVRSIQRFGNKPIIVVIGLLVLLILASCAPIEDPATAIARYSEILATDPDNETALVNRCANYISLARYDEAIEDCTRELRIRPNNIHALQNRATAFWHSGRLRQSLIDWEATLALMEESEFWRKNSPERIDYARRQIQVIRQQLGSGG